MPAFSQAAWVFGAANAGALKAITRAKASMETRVFIVFPPVTSPGRINDLAAAFAQPVLPNVAIAPGAPKKEGAGGLSSGPSFLAACGLGGRGIGRHQLLMSAGIAACRAVRKRGGTPHSALTISKKQFTINLGSRVQLG
jgi:hypothetical protein